MGNTIDDTAFFAQWAKIQWHYRRLKSRHREPSLETSFLRDGVVVVENFLPPGRIATYLDHIPALEAMTPSPEKTQAYLYQEARQDPLFADFFESEFLHRFMKTIIGPKAIMLRGNAKRKHVKGWLGSFEQFFHIDSWQHRLKSFLYLTDVGPENGPLVYIPGSQYGGLHRLSTDYNLYLHAETRSDTYMDDDPSLYAGSFFPHQVNKVLRRLKTQPREITGPAGTLVIFDSRGMHMAKPLEKGERVILQSYWIKEGHHT